MEYKYEGEIIGLTGYSLDYPNYDEMIRRIIELEGGILSGDGQNNKEWEIEQIVIIGEEDFDKDYLIQSIEIGIEYNFTCKYFSLEDFWDFYKEQDYEPYFEGDPRIANHAGLSFLASIGFKYPDVDIFGFGSRKQSNGKGWNIESILRSEFGYSVRAGVLEKERRKALRKAVKSTDIITLQQIAEHIVFNINLRKGKKNMNSAVERWMQDLKWLKRECYDKSIHSFRFPHPN